MIEFLIYLIIGVIVYIWLSVRNVIRSIKEGLTKNEALDKEFKEGFGAEVIMLCITMFIWPLLLIFLVKNIAIKYFAEREIKK